MLNTQQLAVVLFAAPFVMMLGLTALERVRPARREPSQALLNIGVAAYNRVLRLALLPALGLVVNRLTAGLPNLGIDRWPLYWSIPAFVAAMDLGEYFYHRAQHVVPVLWRMHSLHHSDPNVNATTTERHWWGDVFIKSATVWPAIIAVMHPSPVDTTVYVLLLLYHYFSHANVPVNYGWFSWVLNSPAYHRRHHSERPEHFNANFASLFPIFDVILGSYQRPDDFPRTGLPTTPRGLADTVVWPMQDASRGEGDARPGVGGLAPTAELG